MTVDVKSANLILRLWFLMHRDYRLLVNCEDRIYGEKGLTMEQFSVLATIRYVGGPVRPTDIARWMGRGGNSVSMLVDRMVKAGLVRRTRDRIDRRLVNLAATSKGEDALKLAIPASWEFIQNIMLPLSEADRHTFARLLETLRYQTLSYLNPGGDIEAMVVNDDKSHAKNDGATVSQYSALHSSNQTSGWQEEAVNAGSMELQDSLRLYRSTACFSFSALRAVAHCQCFVALIGCIFKSTMLVSTTFVKPACSSISLYSSNL